MTYDDKTKILSHLHELLGELMHNKYLSSIHLREEREPNVRDKILIRIEMTQDHIDLVLSTTESIRKIIDGEND